MAEQWLRLWHGTVTDPKFGMVARDCHAMSRNVTPRHAVLSVWLYLLETASQNSPRGNIDGLDVEVMAFALDMDSDMAVAIVEAMKKRGLIADNSLNGWEKRQPKREDSTAAERKRASRESRRVTQCHTESRNVPLDKIREDKKDQEHVPPPAEPVPPKPAKAKTVTLSTWLANQPDDQDVFSEDDPIFAWAVATKVPNEFIELAWSAFKARYTANTKRYTDWRAVFRNAVRDNWLKLWWIDNDGQYRLTTVGEQARRAAA